MLRLQAGKTKQNKNKWKSFVTLTWHFCLSQKNVISQVLHNSKIDFFYINTLMLYRFLSLVCGWHNYFLALLKSTHLIFIRMDNKKVSYNISSLFFWLYKIKLAKYNYRCGQTPAGLDHCHPNVHPSTDYYTKAFTWPRHSHVIGLTIAESHSLTFMSNVLTEQKDNVQILVGQHYRWAEEWRKTILDDGKRKKKKKIKQFDRRWLTLPTPQTQPMTGEVGGWVGVDQEKEA